MPIIWLVFIGKTFSEGANKVVIGAMPMPVKMANILPDTRVQAGPCKTWAAFLPVAPHPFNEPDALDRISGS